MTQQNSERIQRTGKLQKAILAYLEENNIIPQSVISTNLHLAFDKPESYDGTDEGIELRQPAINRAFRTLDEQDRVLRFKSWFPHPFTDKKILQSYVVLPDCTIFGVPAREAVRMLEVRNGGSLIPWSVNWLRIHCKERTGLVLSAKGIRKLLRITNERILEAMGNPDDDKVWGEVAGQAISAGGVLEFGEKQLEGWGDGKEDIARRYTLSHNDKESPEPSSPRPVAEVLLVDDENGKTDLERRIADLQRRLNESVK